MRGCRYLVKREVLLSLKPLQKRAGWEEGGIYCSCARRREEEDGTEQVVLPVKGEVLLGMSAGP